MKPPPPHKEIPSYLPVLAVSQKPRKANTRRRGFMAGAFCCGGRGSPDTCCQRKDRRGVCVHPPVQTCRSGHAGLQVHLVWGALSGGWVGRSPLGTRLTALSCPSASPLAQALCPSAPSWFQKCLQRPENYMLFHFQINKIDFVQFLFCSKNKSTKYRKFVKYEKYKKGKAIPEPYLW